jgi:hypothetical protein
VRELDKIPGLMETIRRDKTFDGLVRREMEAPGSTGDATARQAGEIFGRTLEDIRQTLNDAGANIGKLDGYAPHNHSARKLLKAGREVWVRRMMSDLDFERTMPGLEPARRAEVLGELWTSIVTGQRPIQAATRDNPFSRRPRNMAAGWEHERTLHFKDADAAAAYHAEFGEGTILDAVQSRIERGARNAGLMETFGPNPELMLESLHNEERLRLRTMTPDELLARAGAKTEKKLRALEHKVLKARAAGDEARAAGYAKEWESILEAVRAERIAEVGQFRVGDRKGGIGMALRVLIGETSTPETPGGAKLARFTRALRAVNSLSSLGSAVLAAIGDVQTASMWYRHGGENIFESVRRGFGMALEGMQAAEKKEIGRGIGFYADKVLGALHSRYTEGDAQAGWLSRNVNNLFKISGLNAWTEAHKAAAGFYLANRMGENAGKAFRELDPHYAATLRRAGLAGRWDVLRSLAGKEADGHTYVLPEAARRLTDAQLEEHMPEHLQAERRPADAEKAEAFDGARARAQHRLRRDLELDLLGYIHDEVGYAVIEPDAKTTAAMTWGGHASGTIAGEAARSVMQFKSFPIAYVQRILMEQRWLRAADEGSFRTHAGGLVFAAASCAVMGYISITARDISRGREPRDPSKIETVFAAIVQGGGLGIWGDFFLGKYNRWGGDMLASFAGPTVNTFFDAATAVNAAAKGDPTGARDQLIRLGTARLPYANLWWAKAALDYGMMFHIREWMSPGSLLRSEAALQKNFNQRYLRIGGLDLTPSKNIQRGGGYK